ncbi:MAG: DUF5684 domain-containing protein [Mucinivorans sp.]
MYCDYDSASVCSILFSSTLSSMLTLLVTALMVVSYWFLFNKANKPGWAAIIPVYDSIIWLRISGRSGWWILMCLVPVANIVFYIIWTVAFARVYGRGGGFAVGLIFLPIIFYPIMAFSSDIRYIGSSSEGGVC